VEKETERGLRRKRMRRWSKSRRRGGWLIRLASSSSLESEMDQVSGGSHLVTQGTDDKSDCRPHPKPPIPHYINLHFHGLLGTLNYPGQYTILI